MDFSFRKEDRILRKNDFLKLYRLGNKKEGLFFFMYYKENKFGSRLGLSVSRKVGSAVVRSRFKRVYRESFRLTKHSFSSPLDIVINVKPSAKEQSNNSIRDDFFKQIKSLGLL